MSNTDRDQRPAKVPAAWVCLAFIGAAAILVAVPVAVLAIGQARLAARNRQIAATLRQTDLALRNYHGESNSASGSAGELMRALQAIQSRRIVDLTHAFEPGIPHWPGFPDEQRETIFSYEEGEGTIGKGFLAHRYTHVGQWGTHCDAPAHFAKDKRTIDKIDPGEMILPLVVLDVHEQVESNPDYTLKMQDVQEWEQRNGRIPAGAFVAMRTDWSKRWPNSKAMRNEDAGGVSHCPGWSLEVLKCLYEDRKITASGHETLDTDPGIATSKGDYSLETYVLGTDHYQIELLDNLRNVPEKGAIAVIAFPKPKSGSGFPARVLAIVP
jgi:kynurenine formamidase